MIRLRILDFLDRLPFKERMRNGAIEFILISYWRSIEDVHKYAHGPAHREAWKWWESTLKHQITLDSCMRCMRRTRACGRCLY